MYAIQGDLSEFLYHYFDSLDLRTLAEIEVRIFYKWVNHAIVVKAAGVKTCESDLASHVEN